MSPRLPRITARELVRALHRDGWYDDDQVGSHLSLRHGEKLGKVIVPMHAEKILRPGLLSRILEDAVLSADQLRRLL
ncbi:MAG: type II toxin-antitoxin system HicA family toxin [Chloroflexota bacterium]